MIEIPAKIKKAFLGIEDHGIFTAMLTVDYGSSAQGIGGYSLDSPAALGREGTAFGCDWILHVLRACGVDEWSQLVGRTIYVLKENDDWRSQPLGIRPLPFERGKEFLFADLTAKHFEGASA